MNPKNGKNNDLIGKLRKMSEDIVMEEVTSDSDVCPVYCFFFFKKNILFFLL